MTAQPWVPPKPPARSRTKPVRPVLTDRQLEILRLVSMGWENPEIAAHLFLSEDTVKTHMRRIMDQFGTRRRTHCVRLGFEWGFLSADRRDRHLVECFELGACQVECPARGAS